MGYLYHDGLSFPLPCSHLTLFRLRGDEHSGLSPRRSQHMGRLLILSVFIHLNTSEKGSGTLGLLLTKTSVKRHPGEISVRTPWTQRNVSQGCQHNSQTQGWARNTHQAPTFGGKQLPSPSQTSLSSHPSCRPR